MRESVDKIHVDKAILNYIVTLVGETRKHHDLLLGASPRASLALAALSKSMAFLQGRDYVVPKDITPIFIDAMAHRLILRPGAENEGVSAAKILKNILASVHAPKI